MHFISKQHFLPLLEEFVYENCLLSTTSLVGSVVEDNVLKNPKYIVTLFCSCYYYFSCISVFYKLVIGLVAFLST